MFSSLASNNSPGIRINNNMSTDPAISVPGLTLNRTGGSFRIGAISQIFSTPPCTMNNVVAVSGHDSPPVCAAFEYTLALRRTRAPSCPLSTTLIVRKSIISSLPWLHSDISSSVTVLQHSVLPSTH
jgi:hypothetical protein